MNNDNTTSSNSSTDTETSLLKSTITAAIIAVAVLVLFILPAEYNIDPTGFGEQIGLTVLAKPNDSSAINVGKTENKTTQTQKDVVTVLVPAGKGVEYKFQLTQYQKMTYQWQTDGASLYLDLHGEPAGDTTGYYESYTIATAKEMSGQFTAPFNGIHGWYWKNKTDKDIHITLTTEGSYSVVGLKQ